MESVLVTGGAGFIGSNFIRYLLTTEPQLQITNLDLLTYAGSLKNLNNLADPARHIFVKGNICDQPLVEEILQERSIDTIVHFAAETHVDRSILKPDQFIQTNVLGTFSLLEAARKIWSGEHAIEDLSSSKVRFHHVSTDEVYGSLAPNEPAFTETSIYAPNSPYAASKAASDYLVRAYGHTYGLPYSISNCSNNYGPYQFPEKMIPLMILNGINGLPMPVYGDGQQIRDWLYVEDHCEAIHTILHKGTPGNTYNIGGENQPTNLLVIQTLCKILDEYQPNSQYTPHHKLIKFVSDRPGHDRRYAMDISKIRHELGWKPNHTLSSGLIKTIDWYLSNPKWVEDIQKQLAYQNWLSINYENR